MKKASYSEVEGTPETTGNSCNLRARDASLGLLVFFLSASAALVGCKSATEYRQEADTVTADIIEQKQQQALGHTEPFAIDRPSDIFRRRLFEDQDLIYSGPATLGADKLEAIEYWPEDDYPARSPETDPVSVLMENGIPKLTLNDALQIGARNNFEYQSFKEAVFQAALDLDLERNEFRNIFTGEFASLIATDSTEGRTTSGLRNSAVFGLDRKFESGAELSSALAVDLAQLLNANGASSLGIAGDATISIPLLRGSGVHIVTEPLTQAERNVVYSIYEFERFRQQFAVGVAREYLGVLSELDELRNAEDDYKSRIATARRSRWLADAGRLPEVQVDQAVQNELRARNRWISTTESYKTTVDRFKALMSLPPDAEIELDRAELDKLTAPARQLSDAIGDSAEMQSNETASADGTVELVAPSREDAGPYEIDESLAMKLALENRVDLLQAQGEVYDAQRAVVVASDALRAELTFFGSASSGERRTIGSATADDAQLRFDRARYSALMTLDLPLERTAERNLYRNSFILLEQAVRNAQALEDQIKLDVRTRLRDLLASREGLRIQAQAIRVAQKRVDSSNLFLEAGRIEIRDLLEAQEALIQTQNALTADAVSYRIAELELQSDMGVLSVDETGLWQEYSPEEAKHARN